MYDELEDDFDEDSLYEDMIRKDKILNNSFNTGEIEYEDFNSPLRVDDKVIGQYRDQLSENVIEVHVLRMLEQKIYEFFESSKFYEKYKNPKKVDKSDMVKMYYYFKERLQKEQSFSTVEIFIGFAEFFQINYDQLYKEVSVKDKELILRELHSKYGLSKKIKTKKLF